MLAPEVDEELISRQYREIKRPLIANAFGKRAARVEHGNLIMVTSALAGEGKTFNSINLALSMARERDHTVLLVDADVAKPHVSTMFGVDDEYGLLDALEDPDVWVRDLVLETDVPGLSILPAGKPRAHATELLASDAMDRITKILGGLDEGQIVVFDSPPLLQTTEAKVLSELAGQTVLVVKAESTSHDAVKMALSYLDDDAAVNLLLNQVRGGMNNTHYGYTYAYGLRAVDDDTSRVETPPQSLWQA